MDAKLGRVTVVSPLKVRLNDDTADAPARGPRGVTLAVGDEVLVVTVERRRLVIWA